MSNDGGGERTVKVTIINTKYVETDAMSFKDVVQKLTGKDSRVAYEAAEPLPTMAVVTKNNNNKIVTSSSQFGNSLGDQGGALNSSSGSKVLLSRNSSSFMMRNISFKEFEKLFREMPPMEELWKTEFN